MTIPRLVRRLTFELMIVAACGMALGFLGPFGTYAMPLGLRLTYWVVFGTVGYAIFRPLILAAEALARNTAMSRTVALGIAMCIAGLPMAWLIGFAINGLRYDADFMRDGFGLLYLQTTAIGLAIHLVVTTMFGRAAPALPDPAPPDRFAQAAPTSNAPSPLTDTQIHALLPPGFGSIDGLTVEDHYVKVLGRDRTAMLLMRLSDAIAMMPGNAGMQVHRSWWVANHAVVRAKRDGRNLKLILAGGAVADVSRANHAAVRIAGWLD
ncbi:MAG: LytTR family transcriptional regulator DNA-binding domain-containing protein [Pontixanthobacter sp.]